MAKQPAAEIAASLPWYEKLVATQPELHVLGASMPYTSVNGHMFSFLTPAGCLALRLPEPERTAFLQKYQTSLCQQHGRVLKEYVEVPDNLLKKPAALRKYFALSYEYASSLKPRQSKSKGGETRR